jgi:outer membrane protein assembly factor BamB
MNNPVVKRGLQVGALALLGLAGWLWVSRAPAPRPPGKPAVPAQWRERWRDSVGARPAGPPVWVADGWCAAFRDGTVVAWNRDGKRRWTLRQAGTHWTAPCAAGTQVILGEAEGNLRALRATDGAVVWLRQLKNASLEHSPVLAPLDDSSALIIALSQGDGVLTALDASTGAVKWQSEESGRTDGPAAIAGNLVLFGNCESSVHLFRTKDGVRQGLIPLGEQAQMAAGLAVCGDLACGLTRDGALVAINLLTTSVVWRVTLGDEDYFASPAADSASRVVFTGTASGELVAVRADTGDILWRRTIADVALDSPVLVKSTLFAGADGTLHLRMAQDGAPLVQFEFGQPLTTPVAAGEPSAGVMVITDDGHVVVLADG